MKRRERAGELPRVTSWAKMTLAMLALGALLAIVVYARSEPAGMWIGLFLPVLAGAILYGLFQRWRARRP